MSLVHGLSCFLPVVSDYVTIRGAQAGNYIVCFEIASLNSVFLLHVVPRFYHFPVNRVVYMILSLGATHFTVNVIFYQYYIES